VCDCHARIVTSSALHDRRHRAITALVNPRRSASSATTTRPARLDTSLPLRVTPRGSQHGERSSLKCRSVLGLCWLDTYCFPCQKDIFVCDFRSAASCYCEIRARDTSKMLPVARLGRGPPNATTSGDINLQAVTRRDGMAVISTSRVGDFDRADSRSDGQIHQSRQPLGRRRQGTRVNATTGAPREVPVSALAGGPRTRRGAHLRCSWSRVRRE
jgi:hypothetical protein